LEEALNIILEINKNFEKIIMGPYMITQDDEFIETAKKMNLFDYIDENKDEKLLLKDLATILYRLDLIKINNRKNFENSLENDTRYINFLSNKYQEEYINNFLDLNYIMNNYYIYPEELNEEYIYNNASLSFIDSLSDPYTNVVDQYLFEETSFSFDQLDLGITLGFKTLQDEKYFYVDEIEEDSYLYKNGLRKNNIITSIFDFDLPIEENSTKEIISELVFKKYLFLEYKNSIYSNISKTIELPIEIKDENNLSIEILENNILYLRIRLFENGIIENMKEQIENIKLFPRDINGYILDLRANPGGDIYSLVKISEYLFPPNNVILKLEDKFGDTRDVKTIDMPYLSNIWKKEKPWIILIDESSASASEVLVHALLDNKQEVIILGQDSYGKGKMQTTLSLPFDSGFMFTMTIAKIKTPNGENSDNIKIKPDFYLDYGELFPTFDKSKDKAIKKAIEILKNNNNKNLTELYK
jgi:carboxyl-terminal processing protease